MASGPRKICRFPIKCPMTKTNKAQPVMAMMYFFPSEEFQILENRFINCRARRTRENLQTVKPHRQRARHRPPADTRLKETGGRETARLSAKMKWLCFFSLLRLRGDLLPFVVGVAAAALFHFVVLLAHSCFTLIR